jgi:hypothetical protein
MLAYDFLGRHFSAIDPAHSNTKPAYANSLEKGSIMHFTRNTGFALACVTILPCLLMTIVDASGQKEDGFGALLPPTVCKELLGRELKTVEAAIGKDDAKAIQKGKVAAMMIAGYALTAKEKSEYLDGVVANALELGLILGEKEKVDTAKKLVAAIGSGKSRDAVKDPKSSFRMVVPKSYDLMVMYMGKTKGGDGLHPDIQSLSPRLQGGEEYIENLFAYLAKKPLAETKVKKGAKELELVGYRTAVSAELIRAYVPKNKTKKRDPELWLQTSNQMRDQALAFAAAANKQDAQGIQKSADAVLKSCVNCHKMFQ